MRRTGLGFWEGCNAMSSRVPEFRSALLDHPGGPVDGCPSVGLAVPIYNEIDHIEQLIGDILSQDYEGIREIWLVDGGSTDGTLEFLQQARSRDARIRVVGNPKRSTASALNMAFGAMSTEIAMRIDAHARYSVDAVGQSVAALLRTGAGGAGSIARPLDATTLMGRAINAAHKSPVGVGVASFRREDAEGWADTIWNGCYWKHVIDQVGPLREDLPRAEDNDFNERVRRLGYGLYLAPSIRAYYRPRQTLRALWSQYFDNGMGVARAFFQNRNAVSLRHLAPLALVTGLLLPLLLAALWPAFALLTLALLTMYVAGLIVAMGISARLNPGLHVFLLPFALLVLHFGYGFGSLLGMATYAVSNRSKGSKSQSQLQRL